SKAAPTSSPNPTFLRRTRARRSSHPGVEPMSATLVCPSCAQQLVVDNQWVGKRVRCPRCQSILDVARQTSPEPSPPQSANSGPGRAELLGWGIAALVFGVILSVLGFVLGGVIPGVAALFGGILIVSASAVAYYAKGVCPGCGSRWLSWQVYLHARKDGG